MSTDLETILLLATTLPLFWLLIKLIKNQNKRVEDSFIDPYTTKDVEKLPPITVITEILKLLFWLCCHTLSRLIIIVGVGILFIVLVNLWFL